MKNNKDLGDIRFDDELEKAEEEKGLLRRVSVNFYFAAKPDGAGAVWVHAFGTRHQALEELERTEQQLKEGSVYDDGTIIEKEVEISLWRNGMVILSPFSIEIDGV